MEPKGFEENPEERLAQERAELPLEDTLAKVEEFCFGRDYAEITINDSESVTDLLVHLFDLYGENEVWDAFIDMHSCPHCVATKNGQRPTVPNPPSCEQENQAEFSNMVSHSEKRRLPYESIQNTFGLHEPTYRNIIAADQDSLERLRGLPKINVALFGSYSKHSANECNAFAKSLNRKAKTTVVDLGHEGIKQADRKILKIQGDVTRLPLASESQDVVFTNFILGHLEDGRGTVPRGEYIVDMIKEGFRCLRPSGIMILVERNPVGSPVATDDILAALLLSATLLRTGFSGYRTGYALSYQDHVAKVRKDKTRIRINKHHETLRFGPVDIALPGPFNFVLLASKKPTQ